MGNCNSTTNTSSHGGGGGEKRNNSKRSKQTKKSKDNKRSDPIQRGEKRHNSLSRDLRLQSIARVGSRVLRDETIRDKVLNDDEHDTPQDGKSHGHLKECKASTYDHVHEIVNLGIESYHNTNQNGNEKGPRTRRRLSGIVGLVNLGNTCFMNSSLQCLSNTIPLTDYFLGYDYRSEINKENFLGTKGALVSSYAELVKNIWLGSKNSFQPDEFKSQLGRFAPQFVGYEQQDAQELLAFLLDGIHEDLNRVKKRPYIEDKDCDGTNDDGDAILAWSNYLERNRSIVVDLFQGQLRNTMTCRNKEKKHTDGSLGCGHVNVKFDPFMYLSLPISDDSNTLDDCLAKFCEEELLIGDEQWYCPKCKCHVDATKKIDLWMLPPILIIHLKRFKFSMCGNRSKIDRSISYPLNDWNLSKAKKSSGGIFPLYDLYAVSHHRGNVGFGHYTAHAKNRFDGDWYDFNDSQAHRIDPVKENLGIGSSAYCLFYNRVERVMKENGKEVRRNPIIRRQSTNRPELWPHLQRSKAREWKSVRPTKDFKWEDEDGTNNEQDARMTV